MLPTASLTGPLFSNGLALLYMRCTTCTGAGGCGERLVNALLPVTSLVFRSLGIVHGDISAENIVLFAKSDGSVHAGSPDAASASRWTPVLLDFDLSYRPDSGRRPAGRSAAKRKWSAIEVRARACPTVAYLPLLLCVRCGVRHGGGRSLVGAQVLDGVPDYDPYLAEAYSLGVLLFAMLTNRTFVLVLAGRLLVHGSLGFLLLVPLCCVCVLVLFVFNSVVLYQLFPRCCSLARNHVPRQLAVSVRVTCRLAV